MTGGPRVTKEGLSTHVLVDRPRGEHTVAVRPMDRQAMEGTMRQLARPLVLSMAIVALIGPGWTAPSKISAWSQACNLGVDGNFFAGMARWSSSVEGAS